MGEDTEGWLRGVAPAHIAAYDQELRQAEVAAAELLTSYINWCGSLDHGNARLAALFHVQFVQAFKAVEHEDMFMIVASLCDTLFQELLHRHGSFEAMVVAAEAGRLFAGGVDQDQMDLFRQLEDLE